MKNGLAQSPWPSESWSAAVNLTSVMNVNGVNDLSGLHWNPTLNRLFLIQGSGKLRVIELNTSNNTFSQIANLVMSGGPEDITQLNYDLNEFYVIDENDYTIKKYTYTANFSTLVPAKSWNLLLPPSPMTETGNTGPEGITFVPDEYLTAAGFVSQVTGNRYISTLGMGGLIFIAHQYFGLIWVFDINPDKSDEFVYVGKYYSNKNESCDLEFDRSTGLLYILHNTWNNNPDNNYLEVTDLKSFLVNGNERKFNVVKEYTIANPATNANIEGFSISPKCDNPDKVSVWLCRDVENTAPADEQTDCIRWFNPFTAEGNCDPNAIEPVTQVNNQIQIYPNPSQNQVSVAIPGKSLSNAGIRVYNTAGKKIKEIENISGKEYILNVDDFEKGIYFIEISQEGNIFTARWLKN